MQIKLLCWRRIDMTGLEFLSLKSGASGLSVKSSTICGWNGGFRIDHAITIHIEMADQAAGQGKLIDFPVHPIHNK